LSTASEPDASGSYTVEDYLKWTYEGLFELIKGQVFKMSPSPSTRHQEISMNLTRKFLNYFDRNACKLYAAPLDVYLMQEGEELKRGKNVVQPDLVVVCNEKKLTDYGCVGAPDLVVEIISPHTSNRDLRLKFDLYEEYGIKEYWIVYPQDKIVQIFTLKEGMYGRPKSYNHEGEACSEIFPELKVDLAEVFKS
jgi:Uma2 family endonuclease